MLSIGLTYDLKDDYRSSGLTPEDLAEFDSAETIDGLQTAIEKCGHRVVRIGRIEALVSRLASGERWDFVFNIAEGLRGMGREAAVPALLDAYDISYSFSDPMVLALALHKGAAKRFIRDCGTPTPAFAVVEVPADVDQVTLNPPLFVKPIAEGTGKGITGKSRVTTRAELVESCARLLSRFGQPVLVERYLPGREFTVGIVGTAADARVLGSMEVVYGEEADGNVYSYVNKSEYEKRVRYLRGQDAEAEQACELALRAYRSFGCRDGGRVDLRSDEDGRPHFIEINPLAGLDPVHSDLPIIARMFGWAYDDLIRAILESGLKRLRRR